MTLGRDQPPRNGERLIYNDGKTKFALTVTGCYKSHDEILTFVRDDGVNDLVIWLFPSGPNKYLSRPEEK